MKTALLLLALTFATGSAQAGISSGKVTFNQGHFGNDLILTGPAAEKIFELLRRKASGQAGRISDGVGVTCYETPDSPLYCQIAIDENGILDLLEIPNLR